MSERKTVAEVKAEIEKLREMKPTVRQFSMFGDDHHKSIDAQIKVLERGFDEDDVYDRYDDRTNSQDSALEAAWWRSGDENYVEDGPPSDQWKGLVVKPAEE